ncbi:MAG: M23 family metallopeptidase, partial [Clostridiales bacterium]
MKKTVVTLLLAVSFLGLPCAPAHGEDQLSLYITATGDTADSIGALSGVEGSLIAAINNIGENQVLPAGLPLNLPEQPILTVTVCPGDTLWSLAQHYGGELSQILDINQLHEQTTLYSGQKLLIPLADETSAVCASPKDFHRNSAAILASRLGENQFCWPLDGVISSYFGKRSRGHHSGLDIANDLGTTIIAAASGTVIEADWKNNAYGYAVMIEHDRRTVTLYAHASSLLVQEGDYVRMGDPIAKVGVTGHTTGPHLHFEVRINTVCCNPLE